MGPIWLPSGGRGPQVGAKMRPKWPLDRPSWDQNGAKMAPRSSSGSENGPCSIQDRQRVKNIKLPLPSWEDFGSQDGPKTSQFGAKMAPQMDQKSIQDAIHFLSGSWIDFLMIF